MFFTNALVTLAGFSYLVAAVPAPVDRNSPIVDRHVVGRGVKAGRSSARLHDKRGALIIQQTVVEPSVTVVQENLGLVNQLALTAEQEFSALVQSQLALVQEVETIKNNIRVNHFAARFSQVNTVIVSVTQLVDLRSPGQRNNRYMINQLLADNGHQSSVVVMLTAASPVTINAAQPTLNLGGLIGSNSSALQSGVAASVIAQASASATSVSAAAASGFPGVSQYDPSNPFGSIGQTVILPYGSKPPGLPNGAQIVSDPASIILPGQSHLIVEDINQFNQDCSLFSSNSLSLFNLQSEVIAAEQIAQVEVSGLSLGSSSSLNAFAAALLGGSSSSINGSSGAIVNVGSASLSTTTTSSAVAATTVSSTSTAAAAAAATPAASAAAVVGAAAPPAAAAPAAGTGVGVQLVPVPPS